MIQFTATESFSEEDEIWFEKKKGYIDGDVKEFINNLMKDKITQYLSEPRRVEAINTIAIQKSETLEAINNGIKAIIDVKAITTGLWSNELI